MEEETVVAHDIAIDGANAGLLDLLGHELEICHGAELGLGLRGWSCCAGRRGSGWRVGLRGLIGIVARAHGGVAHAEDEQVAVELAGCIDVSVSDDVGDPGKGVDGEQGIGCGSGGELGVRSRSEEAALIETVERLAVERGDADAEIVVAEGGLGKDGLQAVGECAFRGSIAWRGPGGGFCVVSLGRQQSGRKEKSCKQERQDSPNDHHAGSVAGGKSFGRG